MKEIKSVPQSILQRFSKLAVITLLLFLLFTGNTWSQPISVDVKITPITEKLIDKNAHVRLEAHDALVSLGTSAVPTLLDALQNQDPNLRWRAAWVLGDMGTEASAAVATLTDALQDKDGQVRMYAVLALGMIGVPAKPAVRALMAALQDKEQDVRLSQRIESGCSGR